MPEAAFDRFNRRDAKARRIPAPSARHGCSTRPKTKSKLRQERHIPPRLPRRNEMKAGRGWRFIWILGTTKIPLLRSYFSAMTRRGTVTVPRSHSAVRRDIFVENRPTNVSSSVRSGLVAVRKDRPYGAWELFGIRNYKDSAPRELPDRASAIRPGQGESIIPSRARLGVADGFYRGRGGCRDGAVPVRG